MKKEEWLKRAKFHKSGTGVRFDLRVYIYGDGHAHFQHIDPDGKVQQENCVVNDQQGAVDVFLSLWDEAETFGQASS